MLAALELHARQLGDTLDEVRNLVAELGAQLLDIRRGVLDDVVQQRRRKRRFVELQPGEDLRDAPRVIDELLSRLAQLSGMGLRGVIERPGQELPVDVRLVRLDLGEQLVDEILVSFEYCHEPHCTARVCGSLPRSSAPVQEEVTLCR